MILRWVVILMPSFARQQTKLSFVCELVWRCDIQCHIDYVCCKRCQHESLYSCWMQYYLRTLKWSPFWVKWSAHDLSVIKVILVRLTTSCAWLLLKLTFKTLPARPNLAQLRTGHEGRNQEKVQIMTCSLLRLTASQVSICNCATVIIFLYVFHMHMRKSILLKSKQIPVSSTHGTFNREFDDPSNWFWARWMARQKTKQRCGVIPTFAELRVKV